MLLGWPATLAIVMACGGGRSESVGGEAPASAASSASGVTSAPRSAVPAGAAARGDGETHNVQMLRTPDGALRFQPERLMIKVGDRVRWHNVSGGPHNVAFVAATLPRGAKDFLTGTMTETMRPLEGRLLFAPNEVYELSFAEAPPGRYEYYCTPHELLGMKGVITIVQ
jgi:plastocyanin